MNRRFGISAHGMKYKIAEVGGPAAHEGIQSGAGKKNS